MTDPGALVHTDILAHVDRLYKNSEVRTPLICCLQDGDPLKSIEALARQQGCAVWTIAMDSAKNEQNALDYLEVGLQNGDWVYLTKNEHATQKTLREVALQLCTVAPEPRHFPKRELFRMWLLVEEDLDINNNINPIFPTLLVQNCLYGRAAPTSPRGSKLRTRDSVEPTLMQLEYEKRCNRKDQGRNSDSESDHEEAEDKKTGLWFHRSVDFYQYDQDAVGSVALRGAQDQIFDAVEQGDLEAARSLVEADADCIHATKAGMTPLLWAVMCDNVPMVQMLLEHGSDPNQRRLANGMPALFMSIEQVALLQLLIDNGADIEARYEGMLLVDHPDTAPEIRSYVKRLGP